MREGHTKTKIKNDRSDRLKIFLCRQYPFPFLTCFDEQFNSRGVSAQVELLSRPPKFAEWFAFFNGEPFGVKRFGRQVILFAFV